MHMNILNEGSLSIDPQMHRLNIDKPSEHYYIKYKLISFQSKMFPNEFTIAVKNNHCFVINIIEVLTFKE